jgi:protein involved in polysaccharide export with SLBB domain
MSAAQMETNVTSIRACAKRRREPHPGDSESRALEISERLCLRHSTQRAGNGDVTRKTALAAIVPALFLAVILLTGGCRTKQEALYPSANPSEPAATANVTRPTRAEPAGVIPYDVLDSERKLVAGDRVTFRIEQDKDEPKALLVTDGGELEIPYLGRVAAADKTCKQLAQEIKAVLEKKYYREATVFLGVDLISKTKGKVYLAGRVRFPGYLDIPADEVFTVSKAVLRAGGFTEFADRRHVKVTRKSNREGPDIEIVTVDIAEVLEKGQAGKDFELKPDDQVFVPSRLVNF